MSSAVREAPRAAEALGHPRGLFVLFFTEMWERFSYYGMRAILVFYLTKHFLFADSPAFGVYGAYTSLVFITPVVGGYLGDRYLGAWKAVLAGGVFIAAGHLLIALFEGPLGARGVHLTGFYLGLAAIVVGTGFLKANVSVLVGELYPRTDPRRDAGFSIFYMGINLGGALGPIVCGVLGERFGWAWGFGAAGLGMLAGLAVFLIARRDLAHVGRPPDGARLREATRWGASREVSIYAGAVLTVPLIWLLVQAHGWVGALLVAFAAGDVGFILYIALRKLPPIERNRILGALLLIAMGPLFWALFEQAGSSLNVYTDRSVDRAVGGMLIPASAFQSINSTFIILFAPLFAALWTGLGRRGLEPAAPTKFGLGMILVGAGFLVLVAGAGLSGGARTPALFVVLLYLFHTAAELCFSPVGLAAMTRLSLPSMTGLMMGTWFLSTAAGNFLASVIAQATGGGSERADQIIPVYVRLGWWAIAAGVAVLLVAKAISRLMRLDLLEEAPQTGSTISPAAHPAPEATI